MYIPLSRYCTVVGPTIVRMWTAQHVRRISTYCQRGTAACQTWGRETMEEARATKAASSASSASMLLLQMKSSAVSVSWAPHLFSAAIAVGSSIPNVMRSSILRGDTMVQVAPPEPVPPVDDGAAWKVAVPWEAEAIELPVEMMAPHDPLGAPPAPRNDRSGCAYRRKGRADFVADPICFASQADVHTVRLNPRFMVSYGRSE